MLLNISTEGLILHFSCFKWKTLTFVANVVAVVLPESYLSVSWVAESKNAVSQLCVVL